jgi:hypothetical protein
MGYVGYDLQHLRVSVNPPAVFRRTSPFPTETGEPPLTLADRIDTFKRDGVSPVIAEVVFIHRRFDRAGLATSPGIFSEQKINPGHLA